MSVKKDVNPVRTTFRETLLFFKVL